jgi:glycosyltransferase involved in cell wall biosynthesis
MRSTGHSTSYELSVILAVYERADALGLLLQSLAEQRNPPRFEILVADDGSGDAIWSVISRYRSRFPITHVWQPHERFRKARVGNGAVLSARGDFLLFLDGDCLPRRGLLRAVKRAALPGWYLASKRVRLSEDFTNDVLRRQLPIWRWSAAEWWIRARREVRKPGLLVPLRDRRRPWRPEQPDFHPPDNAYGFCLGVSRLDFEQVNGYDMRYVGRAHEDVDLAVRLERLGLRCGWPGPGATMFHLWHDVLEDGWNEQRYFETRDGQRTEAIEGLRELGTDLPELLPGTHIVRLRSSDPPAQASRV